MRKSEMRDMTKGNVFNIILGFAIPLLLGMLFQQFYSMVDTIIVGKYLGVSALASVGSTGSINFMIIGFCMGVCNGFAIPVAQKFGAGNFKKLRKYVFNSGFLAIVFSVVMTLIVCVFCRQILIAMRTPEDIIQGAYSYIYVIFLGIPATYLYNLLSGIIRSLGDSKTPLFFLIISSIINIILDLFLIIYMHMGVAGAAWATVIAQAVSGILCLIYMRKKYSVLKFESDELKIDGYCIRRLCYMGIPMGLQYSITAIGSVILQAAVNGLGSIIVAAVTAAGKISMFLCCPFDALGSTMATYTGQNIGAGKLERISEGIKKSMIIGSVYSIVALMISVFFGKSLALLFVNENEIEILAKVSENLIIIAAFYIPLCIVNVVRFTIQGMGYSTFAILAGVCEMIARALCGFILVPIFGYVAVCLASPVAWIFADAFLIPAYKYVINKSKCEMKIKLVEAKNI
ncbi:MULTISPECIES: MATE family efflux transporter [unclassified Clostridium]|uniref:MATE family efflux transporter n=1 Tax=unclassified Clostridium TaxID=2614128 RepID=UPI00033552D7|nr:MULTISPECIES: MATE family efflux transporter [unclassified Clostridium]OKZ88600.1 MAG: MATE family efflux transporter [Clostridium sp. 29_15]CDB74698.1 mate efflux family protein [Clostridium sp. CAG:265]